MAREVVHLYFEHPEISKEETMAVHFTALVGYAIIVLFIAFLLYIQQSNYFIPVMLALSISGVVWILVLMYLYYLFLRHKGENLPEELIIYDNGWFVVWGPVYSDGWVAPAKLDWILPSGIKIKSWGIEAYILPPLNEKARYKKGCKGIMTGFGLSWIYSLNPRYKEYSFHATIYGCVTQEEYKTLEKLAKYLDRIGRRNMEAGRVWIPSGKPQANFIYLKKPFYWNDVFKKEGLRRYYIEDTGEDLPEPVRSFLFDVRKYIKEYLKVAKETGDWFSRKGANREWQIDWEWLERWIEEH